MARLDRWGRRILEKWSPRCPRWPPPTVFDSSVYLHMSAICWLAACASLNWAAIPGSVLGTPTSCFIPMSWSLVANEQTGSANSGGVAGSKRERDIRRRQVLPGERWLYRFPSATGSSPRSALVRIDTALRTVSTAAQTSALASSDGWARWQAHPLGGPAPRRKDRWQSLRRPGQLVRPSGLAFALPAGMTSRLDRPSRLALIRPRDNHSGTSRTLCRYGSSTTTAGIPIRIGPRRFAGMVQRPSW